jgi:DNA-binding NtrC family response regulator
MVRSVLDSSMRSSRFYGGRPASETSSRMTMTDRPMNTVLIVDDELAIRSMLQRFFKSAGFFVGCAENGVEGLKLFKQADWDVVIVDRGMPELNGEEMTREIKTSHPHVPVILITGLPHAVTRPEQYVAVLAKPFHPMELVDIVSQAIAASPRKEKTRLAPGSHA